MTSVRKFAWTVIKVFEIEHIKPPNVEDTIRHVAIGEARGQQGML
jgi:hypothetical protein